jgi:two-component system NtrC family sensor kinase
MTKNDRILVIDDDAGVRESYVEILSPTPTMEIMRRGAALFNEENPQLVKDLPESYNLTLLERGELAAETIKEALKRKMPFAAAFIDMRMPGIDGAETAKRIWSIDPRVKIVIITAYSDLTPDDIIKITQREDLFFLRKPFNSEEIRQFARALAYQWNLEREKNHLGRKLKEANNSLDEINKNLQKKVESQAAMLIQAEKMASIGLLAAGVAHEINNPISFVNSNLTTLGKYSARIAKLLQKYGELEQWAGQGDREKVMLLTEEIKKFKETQKINYILEDLVHTIDESLEGTKRVQDIVMDLRNFSRAEHHDLSFVDLNEVLNGALKMVHNELKNKAEILRDYEEVPKVQCFSQKISQVFMNLLLNAAQAIQGTGTIRISTRPLKEGRRADDEMVEVRIEDNGVGIPKKDLNRIFDPFFTTKPVGQGTGLGLSIAYDIVKSHGGKILVESEEGTGTTVIVRLPLKAKL